ncbi:hypothetical protein D3C76_1382280 [compost metagenome]
MAGPRRAARRYELVVSHRLETMLSNKSQTLEFGTGDTCGLSLVIMLQRLDCLGVQEMVRGKHLAEVFHAYLLRSEFNGEHLANSPSVSPACGGHRPRWHTGLTRHEAAESA